MSSITEQVGRIVGGRYRLLTPIGSGASSQVFAAIDTRLGRRVAVKVLHPTLASDAAFLRRFRAEARLAASLDHPHVMRVFDWGEEDAGPYLVLELLTGGSLRALLDAGVRLSHAQVASFGSEAASGLAYAHRRGIIHRDIKPGNLLFDDDGHARIADFGVARAIAQASLTEPLGTMFGTARYASPEQAKGGVLDDRTDVYSLALVLYEALTGRVPFSAETVSGTLMARIDASLPPARELGPLTPILAAAAIADPIVRLDAASLAAELGQLERQLPPAIPLPLARIDLGPGAALWADRDATDVDPAEAGHHPTTPYSQVALDDPPTPHLISPDELIDDLTAMGIAAGEGVPAAGARSRSGGGAAAGGGADGAGTSTAGAGETSRRRGRLGLAIAAIVLLLGLLAAGVTALVVLFGVDGHLVPSVDRQPVGTARVLLQDADLRVRLGGSVYDGAVPRGDVVSQSVPPGRRVKAGTVVVLTESLGWAPVPVPDVTRLTQKLARQLITSSHLRPVPQLAYSEVVPAGHVISQDPAASSRTVPRGSPVILYISRGPHPRVVPELSGLTLAAAEQQLAKMGLVGKPAATGQYSMTVPQGDVISQYPLAHLSVRRGSLVLLTVSLGKPFVKVPHVFGISVSKAEARLSAAGLGYHVYGAKHGIIVYSSPDGGTSVREGTTITLAAIL